jgi:outer membrane protein assembly factor BamB
MGGKFVMDMGGDCIGNAGIIDYRIACRIERIMMRKMIYVTTAMLFVCIVSQSIYAWPNFRGPDRDGKAATGTQLLSVWPESGLPMLWKYDQLGEGYASAAIADGKVFITGMEGETGYLYALDMNGNLVWKTPYGPEWAKSYRGSRTTPTVMHGKVYIMSGFGRAACYNAATGKEVWAVDTMQKFGARNISWGITESPLVYDNKVILSLGGPDAGIVALDAATGNTLWVVNGVNDKSGYCSPFLIERGGRKIIVQLMGTTFVGIDAKDGKLLWREVREPSPAHSIQAVPPVYADGMFYITSGYGGQRGAMYQLNKTGTGVALAWQDSELDCHHGGLILHNGYIYGAADRNNRNKWLCMNIKDGTVVSKIDAVGKGSVSFADGMLYTLSEKGTLGLVKADPNDFRLISSCKVPSGGSGPHWAHPSISDGRLYIRHSGSLFVYDISAK